MDPQTPPTEATQYALRVALQTMKERCQILQKRLNSLEDENQHLRAGKDDIKSTSSIATTPNVGFAAENFQLRLQLAELERQKSQLTEQINMVSTENRKLWSRLSQMAKNQDAKNLSGDNDDDDALVECNKSELLRNGANQNLIRSKTFTQHSPNPKLRHKLISHVEAAAAAAAGAAAAEYQTMNVLKDESLEEVNLCADAGEAMATPTASDIGFAYVNMDEHNYQSDAQDITEAHFQLEAKKCADGLQDIRSEVLQQQKDLQLTMAVLKQKLAKLPCAECAKKTKKPEMADKSLETDESLTEANAAHIPNAYKNDAASATTPRLNFIQEKIEADSRLKTCPMCGKLFNESVSFKDFCEHVESHFSSETSDFGSMLEHDFECISNTVGNF